jgi:hypothetical protein
MAGYGCSADTAFEQFGWAFREMKMGKIFELIRGAV